MIWRCCRHNVELWCRGRSFGLICLELDRLDAFFNAGDNYLVLIIFWIGSLLSVHHQVEYQVRVTSLFRVHRASVVTPMSQITLGFK